MMKKYLFVIIAICHESKHFSALMANGGLMMSDRKSVMQALKDSLRNQHCGFIEGVGNVYAVSEETINDTLDLLKEQEARELTIDEWREWKANPKRNPICELWEHDTSPMWILNPNDVHEPAFLMGKLKLFTGKPTFEQCKEVNWG